MIYNLCEINDCLHHIPLCLIYFLIFMFEILKLVLQDFNLIHFSLLFNLQVHCLNVIYKIHKVLWIKKLFGLTYLFLWNPILPMWHPIGGGPFAISLDDIGDYVLAWPTLMLNSCGWNLVDCTLGMQGVWNVVPSFVALLPTWGVTRPCRKMMMCNCNMTYWKYGCCKTRYYMPCKIANKIEHHVNYFCIQIFMHGWSLTTCYIFLFMRIGGKHCIIWMHKVLGMWWLEYRFGLHEGIKHFRDSFVKWLGQVHYDFIYNNVPKLLGVSHL